MKERFEWIHSWLDDTPATDKKRVLLVGDSICNGYEELVRNRLADEFHVDFVATSHSADSEFYRALVTGVAKDMKYDLIHYNFGLHGFHMDAEAYRRAYETVLGDLIAIAPVQVALSTTVFEPGNEKLHPMQNPAAMERNAVVLDLAKKYGLTVDDLWTVSTNIPTSGRSDDGIHYVTEGWNTLADAVAASIRKYFH